MHVIRKFYSEDFDGDGFSIATGLKCVDASLTQQSQKEEADINTLVKRFGVTGLMPQGVAVPQYKDFDDVFDFQSAMNVINEAKHSFMQMPGAIRRRFGDDPQQFLEFCGDKDNLDEMRKMGLALPEVVTEVAPVMKVEVVNPVEPPK